MAGKMTVYQMLPRLWGNSADELCGKFSKVDEATLAYLRDELGVSHIWYTGIIRHATTYSCEGCPASFPSIVKGAAGSPYAIVDYYDVNPYLADNPSERMSEFESLLNRTHSSGLKALIDFVPNHVSRDYGKSGGLGMGDDPSVHWRPENDFYYYPGQPLVLPASAGDYYENPAKASGNCFSPFPGKNDWYETIRLNYCDFHTPTWDKMLSAVLFWCAKGVDGFRCDMVEMVPWQFMKWLIERVKSKYPGVIFIAEVYQKDLYRHYIDTVGFDFLYDKSGLYDTLRSVVEGKGTAQAITWNWQMLGDLQPRMLNFLENHDEQRFASNFFGRDASRTPAPLCTSMLFNTAPFMIYFGEEIGERGMDSEGFSGLDGRTTIFDWWSVASIRRLYEYIHGNDVLEPKEKETLEVFRKAASLAAEPAVAIGRTFDLGYCNHTSNGFDPDHHFAFMRGDGERVLLFLCNFSNSDASVEIFIPEEAVRFFGMKKTEAFKVNASVKSFGYSVLPV
ncbi:MAG: alpha-amylase [Bacteroidales bacterium]|nr:alpha-amylase [Bacteroidales bacterium]